MLYFEDSLWIRENFWKDAIGTMYFGIGFIGIAFHLILISILPEIGNFISRPTVIILTAQFTASILQLFVVFVPVPAMIAVNKPYFLNPVMINVPAFLLVLSQCFSFIFMMVHGFYRNLKIIWPKAAKIIFIDRFHYGIIIFVLGISSFFTINICVKTTIRRFNPAHLNWKLQYFEVISYIYLLGVILIPTLISHIVILSNSLFRKIFEKPNAEIEEEQEGVESTKTTICSTSFYILFDLIFGFWISLSFLSSDPILSISHVFLTAYWPILTALTLDIHVRAALIYRIHGVFQPQAAATPVVIRSNKGKFSKF